MVEKITEGNEVASELISPEATAINTAISMSREGQEEILERIRERKLEEFNNFIQQELEKGMAYKWDSCITVHNNAALNSNSIDCLPPKDNLRPFTYETNGGFTILVGANREIYLCSDAVVPDLNNIGFSAATETLWIPFNSHTFSPTPYDVTLNSWYNKVVNSWSK